MEITIQPIVDGSNNCTLLLRNGRNISSRKKAELKLRESEEQLSLALSASNIGFYDLNLVTGEAKVSDEYSSMLEYNPTTFIETYSFWKKRLHPDDKKKALSALKAILKGLTKEYKAEFRNLTRSGKWIWISSIGKVISWDAAGKPTRMIGTHKNITEIKITDLAIRQTNKELQEVIDALDESSLVSVTDRNGTILKVNKLFCEVAGYKEEELLGKNHKIINSGYHTKQFWQNFWRTIGRGEVWKGVIRNRAKNGTEYWVNTVINPIRNEQGKITRYLSIRQDITNQKVYEQLLLQSNSRLAQIEQFIDLTTDAIQVADEQGKLIYLNHVAAKRLGINKNECDQFHVWDFEQVFEEGDSWKKYVEELKNKSQLTTEGTTVNKKTGKQFPVEVTTRYVVIQNKGYVISISRDITERRKNEILLREQEARLSEAQRLAKLGYWEIDLVTGKVWWSDQQYRIYGITKTDAPPSQESFFNFIYPDDKTVLIEMLNKATPESPEFSIDFKIVRPGHETRVVQALIRTTFNEQAKPIKLTGVNQDITEKYIAGNLLKEREETLRKAQHVAKIGSWKLDVQNNFLKWSDETYTIFNLPPDQKLTYETFLSFVHPEDKEKVDKAWKAALSGAPYDIVHRILVDNKIKWVRELAELTFDEYNNLNYGFGIVQDITDQKNLKEAYHIVNETQLLTGLGSWRWSLKSGEIFWSDSIYYLLGLDKATTEPSYENYLNTIYWEDRDRAKNLGEASLAGKTPFEIEFRVEVSSNETRWLLNKGNVLKDEEGNAIEIYGVIRDITSEKLNTERLVEAMKRAEEAAMVKEEFLSIMSHELRTPLNSVIGLTNLLLRRNPREDQFEVIKTLKGSADNLLHLVNGILDFNKIRAGKVELESLPFSLHNFLNHLHNSFNPLALDKGLSFSIQCDPQIPDLLIGDETRLNQIFNNLLSNAIKFTHQGHIKLLVNSKRISEQTCSVIFNVEDTGIGIQPNKLDTIFLPFHQSERETTRKYGGTGLGLSIVKALVQLFNGRVDVSSLLGKGTVFRVELEFHLDRSLKNAFLPLTKRELSTQEFFHLNKFTLLYVEDVESNRYLIENLLSDNHIECISVSSGRAALKYTKSKKFDIILMDIQMPVMDGYQTASKIRTQIDGKNKKTPIIAFTAEPYSDQLKSKVVQHHMQDVISKPFEIELLMMKIREYTKSQEKADPLFSFSFYEKAFEQDVIKLKKIKKAVLSDLRRFEKKMTAIETNTNTATLQSEIHRIKPILKNLACNDLLELLENYKQHEMSRTRVKRAAREARKLVKLLLLQLSKVNY
jgi:PAS domain S-box-containing protein